MNAIYSEEDHIADNIDTPDTHIMLIANLHINYLPYNIDSIYYQLDHNATIKLDYLPLNCSGFTLNNRFATVVILYNLPPLIQSIEHLYIRDLSFRHNLMIACPRQEYYNCKYRRHFHHYIHRQYEFYITY
jgi:hypothetical protein